MAGKRVLITGAAKGIGFEVASAFLEEGDRVAILDYDQQGLAEALDRLGGVGPDRFGVACDVTDEAALHSAVDQVIEQFGGLDVLINNAGVQYVAPIEDFPSDSYRKLLDIMLVAPFLIIKHIFPVMKQQKGGRIINLASINGLVGFAGKAGYNSAKHGVIGLTKVAALEGAEHGITVNALCPGYVNTEMVRGQLNDLAKSRNVPLEKVLEEVIYPLVPQKRLLEPREVADYCLFLASGRGRGITGQAVVIDGGYTAQ
ncbi:3-hydroxybutyrate dehydrogenase [Amphritea sp. 1_MG-2023]|uniref:3-hydroxybutyrate dehydrogenase n=1 Tax=Amphritea sp. 1_MG-2023 TaxID=3062670 RepID=UPI0026E126F8|nr:3-hydroxybutyrate dehydrogenase [Amphritea sp. 1_MG-2023]MDO6563370.1 3-hydroxybutyrate dehydrogenase [Amphritea sp. 1_MG-2023]